MNAHAVECDLSPGSEANLFRKILVELASQLLRIKLFMLSLLHCSADVCVCSYPGKTGWMVVDEMAKDSRVENI